MHTNLTKKEQEMINKSKRINQLKITLVDNRPNMLDNHWFDPGFNVKGRPSQYSGRYKLLVRLTTPQRNFTLESNLQWPFNDLTRRGRCKQHAVLYKQWRDETQAIKDDILRPSSLPPLVGFPAEKQKFKGQKGLQTKWYAPPVPSLWRVQALRDQERNISWNIQWLFPDQTLEFNVEPTDCKVVQWPHKDGGDSVAYIKTYAHSFNLPEDYYMPRIPEQFIQEDIDYEYEQFKQRVDKLINQPQTQLLYEEFKALMVKFPAYAERLNKETGQ